MVDSVTARCPGTVAASAKSSPCPCSTVHEAFLLQCCLDFTKHGAGHLGWTTPPWTHLSTGHGSRSLVTCSDAHLWTSLVAVVSSKPYSLFAWTLPFNMLSEACGVSTKGVFIIYLNKAVVITFQKNVVWWNLFSTCGKGGKNRQEHVFKIHFNDAKMPQKAQRVKPQWINSKLKKKSALWQEICSC